MQLIKKTKKGFTLVELIVVIAIVAILAAVSVVSYLAFINSANESFDVQLVKQLNTCLQADEALNGQRKSVNDVLDVIESNGFHLPDLTKTASGNDIVYDQVNNRFALVNNLLGADKIVYGEDSYATSHLKYQTWVLVDTIKEAEAITDKHYAVYLTEYVGNYDEPFTVKGGFDAGSNIIETVIYDNTEEGATKQVVTLRTRGGTLKVKGFVNNDSSDGDILYLYGLTNKVEVIKCWDHSLHIEDRVSYIALEDGRTVVGNNSNIGSIYLKNNNVIVAVKDGATLPTVNRAANVTQYYVQETDSSKQAKVINEYLVKIEGETPKVYTVNADKSQGEEIQQSELSKGVQNIVNNTRTATPETVIENEGTDNVEPILDEKYVCRIGTKGYETFSEAFTFANQNNETTIVLLNDIALTSNYTFNRNITIDLNSYELYFYYLNKSFTFAESTNVCFKNGYLTIVKTLTIYPGCSIRFDNVYFERYSHSGSNGQIFQFYKKQNINVEFNNSRITYLLYEGNAFNESQRNGQCFGSFNDCTNINIVIKNTNIIWSNNVPFVQFTGTTNTNCSLKIDDYSLDCLNNVEKVINFSSNNWFVKKLTENNLNIYYPSEATYWKNQVSEKPSSYSEENNDIYLNDEIAFAWFAHESVENTFEGKTVHLNSNLDMVEHLWEPIYSSTETKTYGGSFAGIFDGHNYTIKNIYTQSGYDRYGNGIFHRVSGTIKNLVIDKATIGVDDLCNGAGVIAGYAVGNAYFNNITIKNCNVIGTGKVAGIIGMGTSSSDVFSFVNCRLQNVKIEGKYNCAGLIGLSHGASNVSGCMFDKVDFHSLRESGMSYIEESVDSYLGLYWGIIHDNDDDVDCYFAAWADLYCDYESFVIGDYTYVGRCHNL